MQIHRPKTDPRSISYPCHSCHRPGTVEWSKKRQAFICCDCQKVFDEEVVIRRASKRYVTSAYKEVSLALALLHEPIEVRNHSRPAIERRLRKAKALLRREAEI